MDIITTAVTPITLDTGKIVHAVKVDFTERRFPPTVKIVQYDKSLPVIAASLYQGGAVYTIPAGAAVNIRVRKPDNTYVYNGAIGCDTARHVAYFEVSEQMAAAYGDGRATVELVVNGEIAGTSLILLQIEENPVPEDAIESSDEYQTIYDLYDMIKSTIVNPVTLASEMTDTSIVYLYIGDETGYNKGHMYFYNGTTWVDAGICSTDTTLSISGMAADAKATGDAIATKQNTLTFDSAPTNGSTNPVTSGGVYTAVKTVNDSVTELGEELTDTQTDVSALQERLLSAFATDTASGTVASFQDGADGVPVKALSVEVEAVQASGTPSPDNVLPISGWDSVKVTRTGANLANSDKMLLIGSDVTYTEADGYYFPRNFSNLSDACAVFVNESKLPMQLSLAYDVKHSGDEGDGSIIRINYTDGTYTRSASSTTPADEWRHVTVTSDPNKVISSVKYSYLRPTRPTWIKNIQLNVGDTASDYESYNGTVYDIDLPQTVYGGSLDVTSGVLTLTHWCVDMGDMSWSYYADSTVFRANKSGFPHTPAFASGGTGALCTCYAPYTGALANLPNMSFIPFNSSASATFLFVKDTTYTDAVTFRSAVRGQYVCYEMVTPQTMTLTPEQVTTLLGQNNIYADSGSVAVTYRADTGLYIQKVINA